MTLPHASTSLPSPWMNSAEAAEYLRISVSRLAHLARTGAGPKWHRPPGSKIVRYNVAELDAFLREPLQSTTAGRTRDRELVGAAA